MTLQLVGPLVVDQDAQIGAALTPAQRAVYQERIRSRAGDMPKPGADWSGIRSACTTIVGVSASFPFRKSVFGV